MARQSALTVRGICAQVAHGRHLRDRQDVPVGQEQLRPGEPGDVGFGGGGDRNEYIYIYICMYVCMYVYILWSVGQYILVGSVQGVQHIPIEALGCGSAKAGSLDCWTVECAHGESTSAPGGIRGACERAREQPTEGGISRADALESKVSRRDPIAGAGTPPHPTHTH
jgi:hypothetical protein